MLDSTQEGEASEEGQAEDQVMRNFHPIQPERPPTPPRSHHLTPREWLIIAMVWVAIGSVAVAIATGHA
jgi:hypothetical protein